MQDYVKVFGDLKSKRIMLAIKPEWSTTKNLAIFMDDDEGSRLEIESLRNHTAISLAKNGNVVEQVKLERPQQGAEYLKNAKFEPVVGKTALFELKVGDVTIIGSESDFEKLALTMLNSIEDFGVKPDVTETAY